MSHIMSSLHLERHALVGVNCLGKAYPIWSLPDVLYHNSARPMISSDGCCGPEHLEGLCCTHTERERVRDWHLGPTA